MQEWNLKPGSQPVIYLSADARLTATNYDDDQTWEFLLGGGEPPGVSLHTTYGLRSRSMRIFPRFGEGDVIVSDPDAFATSVTIHKIYPNYLEITFSPFQGIDVNAAYWVPESHAVCSRVKVTNSGISTRVIRLELVALLAPAQGGERMSPVEIAAATVLAGKTSNLAPLLFVTSGPQAGSGSFPSLELRLEIPKKKTQQVTWVQTALADAKASFELARKITTHNWEGERARIEMLNNGSISVHTGNPDWDACLALSQKEAYRLILSGTPQLPGKSFVSTRNPDQGYSLRGDGSDYNYLWNGQTAFDSYYLFGLILPAAPQLAQDILLNFITTCNEFGFIDWKPGLGGQRSQMLAMPLLASLAWQSYQVTEDKSFLESIFDPLLSFLRLWFSPAHDRDNDGVPEWSHPMQTGYDDHPVFAHWQRYSQGVSITTAESPDLCSFLFRECCILARIAAEINHKDAVPALQEIASQLKNAVEATWEEESASYYYRDRDSHASTTRMALGMLKGSGTISIHREVDLPVRIQGQIHTQGEATRRVNIFVHGSGPSGVHRVERIKHDQVRWYMGRGNVTSERIYTALEFIEIQGLDEEDQITFHSVGYKNMDQTVLLPLWAGIPDTERAEMLISRTICNQDFFWSNKGIQACPPTPVSPDDNSPGQNIQLPWNLLIGEGLLAYGYQEKAAELVTHLMDTLIRNLKSEGVFRRSYHSQTDQGMGDKNALAGLAPASLFLNALGVQIINSRKVFVKGFNPFPWPVTVKYRGMAVMRLKDKTIVVFPDGQTATTSDPAAQIISMA